MQALGKKASSDWSPNTSRELNQNRRTVTEQKL